MKKIEDELSELKKNLITRNTDLVKQLRKLFAGI